MNTVKTTVLNSFLFRARGNKNSPSPPLDTQSQPWSQHIEQLRE